MLVEEAIRENLDIGRPSQMQSILDGRIARNTPSRFRTRALSDRRRGPPIDNTRHFGTGELQLLAGRRRVRASKWCGLSKWMGDRIVGPIVAQQRAGAEDRTTPARSTVPARAHGRTAGPSPFDLCRAAFDQL